MSQGSEAWILERFTRLLARHPDKMSVHDDWVGFIERFHGQGLLTDAERDRLIAAFLDRDMPLAC